MTHEVKIQLVRETSKEPQYATEGALAVDLRADIRKTLSIPAGETALIPTGLRVELPPGLGMFAIPRSGKGSKEGKVLANLVGLIDEDYRGEVMVAMWNRNRDHSIAVDPDEAIAQAVFVPVVRPTLTLVGSLSETVRADGGFGSTDEASYG